MPTRNVNLTDELDRFVAKKVKTGRYENASEVVRAGLRTLEREEQQYEAKIAALRAAIDAGDASGASPSGLRPPGLAKRRAKSKDKIKPKYHVPADHPWRKPWSRTFLLCVDTKRSQEELGTTQFTGEELQVKFFRDFC